MGVSFYDPESWKVVWNGIPILGFAQGSFLKVARRTETTTLTVGADGGYTFVLSKDRSATLEFTLRREHVTNRLLSEKMALMERGGLTALGAFGPVLVEQILTGTKTDGEFAAISKRPDQEGATDYSPIVWQLVIGNASMFDGAFSVGGQQG